MKDVVVGRCGGGGCGQLYNALKVRKTIDHVLFGSMIEALNKTL